MRIIDPSPGWRRIVKRHGHETAGFSLVEPTMTPGRRLDSFAALARAQQFRTATVSVDVHTNQRVEFCGHDHDDSADEMGLIARPTKELSSTTVHQSGSLFPPGGLSFFVNFAHRNSDWSLKTAGFLPSGVGGRRTPQRHK